jgi:hypothetical protein
VPPPAAKPPPSPLYAPNAPESPLPPRILSGIAILPNSPLRRAIAELAFPQLHPDQTTVDTSEAYD